MTFSESVRGETLTVDEVTSILREHGCDGKEERAYWVDTRLADRDSCDGDTLMDWLGY